MPTITSVTKYFPKAKEGFVTTLASTVAMSAATVPLNSVTGYTNGDTVVLVVDPGDASKKQVFTGIVDTAGVQITNVVWTEGTDQSHTAGSTVVDYVTATHMSIVSAGILKHANPDGSLLSSAVRAALGETATTGAGWTSVGYAPNTVTCNGQRSFDLVFNSVDLSTSLSAGMRLRTTRTTAAPTQCTSLNGTTQYWVKTSPSAMTFTDDFVVSAWIKLSSYPTSAGVIMSRYNGTSGWKFEIESSGQIQLAGFNAGAGNYSYVRSYQAIPLNKWVHITAQLDMSAFTATTTTSYVMVDGVDVPASVIRAGTNPTALIQAGNLEVGSTSTGTLLFPGKIAQAAVFNAKVTQATIRGYMSQTLGGSETSLISAYSFNNSTNDLSANANNLSAGAGSPTATNADSPFGCQVDGTISSTLDYCIIQKVSFSTNTTVTVQVPEGCTIPTSGGVSAVSYSPMKAPYGFPSQKGKWRITQLFNTNIGLVTFGATTTWTSHTGVTNFTLPVGQYHIGYQGCVQFNSTVSGVRDGSITLESSTPSNSIRFQLMAANAYSGASTTDALSTLAKFSTVDTSAALTYVLYGFLVVATGTEKFGVRGDIAPFEIYAENAHL